MVGLLLGLPVMQCSLPTKSAPRKDRFVRLTDVRTHNALQLAAFAGFNVVAADGFRH